MGTITRSFANNITSGGTFDATDLTGTIPASNIADASVTNITAVPALVATTTVASDPPSPDAGQIWYNTTDKALRAYIQSSTGSWATGNDLNTARQLLGGTGTQTSALGFGGYVAAETAVTESYNGTSWTEVNDLNTARRNLGSAGIDNTSALTYGGNTAAPANAANTESWNGTSWTEVNDLNTARRAISGAGTQTSAIGAGGDLAPGYQTLAESWNGTSWTEVNDLNTARGTMNGKAGADNTSALIFSGTPLPVAGALTESWNGTSWTEVSDLNNTRDYLTGAGIQTSALAFGGENAGFKAFTEEWNGSSWTEVGDLNLARYTLAGAGNTAAALAFGGDGSPPGNVLANTEEWSKPNVVTDLGVS